jgi:hypothetical protein
MSQLLNVRNKIQQSKKIYTLFTFVLAFLNFIKNSNP